MKIIPLNSENGNGFHVLEFKTEEPTPTVDPPTYEELKEMILEGVTQATDGCETELDGVCEHGHPSWLIKLGLI